MNLPAKQTEVAIWEAIELLKKLRDQHAQQVQVLDGTMNFLQRRADEIAALNINKEVGSAESK